MKNLGREGGFTLVEVLFALFIGGLLMTAIYLTMISGQKSSTGVERKVAAQQDVRAALDIMAMEIGMASYNPNYVLGLWVQAPGDCATAGTQSYRGIQEATPTAITVEMDIGENGRIAGTDANEVVRYAYDAANQDITRSVNCGTADPFLGGAVPGTKTVNVINGAAGINNGANPPVPAIFRYYNSSGSELYPYAGQVPGPADIPNIRRINITLAVETEEADPSTQRKRQMNYSTSVLVRNHGIN